MYHNKINHVVLPPSVATSTPCAAMANLTSKKQKVTQDVKPNHQITKPVVPVTIEEKLGSVDNSPSLSTHRALCAVSSDTARFRGQAAESKALESKCQQPLEPLPLPNAFSSKVLSIGNTLFVECLPNCIVDRLLYQWNQNVHCIANEYNYFLYLIILEMLNISPRFVTELTIVEVINYHIALETTKRLDVEQNEGKVRNQLLSLFKLDKSLIDMDVESVESIEYKQADSSGDTALKLVKSI